ncbi:amidohydrolase family protein [Celerinatantimonas sp. YJH-8]|uniref:amidohydrolase family protein n=1 Tax=Celerinatantimonas sp. YJH-8 TaxID=3228714 RepID=UPI0038C688FA
MKKTIITNAIVFTVDPNNTVIRNGTLIIEDGKISAIGRKEAIALPADADEIIDGHGTMAVLPGLIDTHNHSSLMRGVAEDMRLVEWLPIYDLEHKACNPDDAYHAARLTYLECLKNGTTTIMDMYRFMDRSAEAAGELGLRVHLAPYAADIEPYTFFESTQSNMQLLNRYHMSQDGRVRVWMGLENLYYCSKAMYDAALIAQREYGVGIHTHGCEQREEEESIIQMFGMSTIDMLEQRGILGEKTLLAHCVWVNDDDIKKMAATGTNLAHCATSAAKLGCGIAPIPKMLAEGVNVSIGSDGMIDNNSLDLFQEMKFGSLIQKASHCDASLMSAPQMLRMATINGAKSLGMDREIGSLELGKSADLIMVDTFVPNLHPIFWDETEQTNLLWNLIFAAKGENVDTVMVEGNILMRHRKLTQASESDIILGAQDQGDDWMKRREAYK